MDFILIIFFILLFICENQGEYCAVQVPGHHNSYQIRCSSACCGSGFDTKCCVSGDMIVGIFFACVACVTIFVTLLYCCIKHKTQREMRSNSHSELSFIGSHNRFYHPYSAQPIKPPPYKQYDPPPSYSEQPERSQVPTRPTRSIPWARRTPHPPAYSHTPRQILVTSPPPPYISSESCTPESAPALYTLSVETQQSYPQNQPIIPDETSEITQSDGSSDNATHLTEFETHAEPSTSQSVNNDQALINERVAEMFQVTQNTSLPNASQARRKSEPESDQGRNVQKQFGKKQKDQQHGGSSAAVQSQSSHKQGKHSVNKTNSV